MHVELHNDINSVPLLLEGNGATCKETGLIIESQTEQIEEGALLGDAEETCVVIPPEDRCDVQYLEMLSRSEWKVLEKNKAMQVGIWSGNSPRFSRLC